MESQLTAWVWGVGLVGMQRAGISGLCHSPLLVGVDNHLQTLVFSPALLPLTFFLL